MKALKLLVSTCITVLVFSNTDPLYANCLIRQDQEGDKHISDTVLSSGKGKRYKNQTAFILEKGIQTGYSKQATYRYRPLLVQFEFQKPIRLQSKGIYLDYFLQPQFNLVQYQDKVQSGVSGSFTGSWETGVNMGLVLSAPLFARASKVDQTVIYALGSLGPHYISSGPSRQAKGFLFSDNLRLGLRIPVSSFLQIDLRTGIRHLSNASLKAPNHGIDDIMFGAGIRFVKE